MFSLFKRFTYLTHSVSNGMHKWMNEWCEYYDFLLLCLSIIFNLSIRSHCSPNDVQSSRCCFFVCARAMFLFAEINLLVINLKNNVSMRASVCVFVVNASGYNFANPISFLLTNVHALPCTQYRLSDINTNTIDRERQRKLKNKSIQKWK